MSLTVRIVIAMVAGMLLGALLHALNLNPDGWIRAGLIDGVFYAGGQIFINSLKLMVVPLVLVSLVCGVSNISDGNTLGKLGGKSVGLYLLTTAIAVSLALTAALIVEPGVSVDREAVTPAAFEPRPAPPLVQVIIDIFPSNPVASMADAKMLQLIVFAILLGIAVAWSGESGARIKGLFEDLNAVVMRLVTILISFAPYGVFCLMIKLFTDLGLGEIERLLVYFLTVAGVLVIHWAVVYPTLLTVLGRVSPLAFLAKMREPILVAFSTSSSGATLPVTLRTVERKVGVSNEVASFVVPLGATINMDGTAIMQGVATVFIAQYFGIDLSFTDYLMVILTATLASVGTAGVPGVGLIMLALVLDQVGLPVEGIGLIIGVDRLLDMMRTSVNVTGDGMVALVVARSEGKLDLATFNDPDAGRVLDDEGEKALEDVADTAAGSGRT